MRLPRSLGSLPPGEASCASGAGARIGLAHLPTSVRPAHVTEG